MMLFILLAVVLLTGCNNSPSRDDYARHVNTLEAVNINESNFKFDFIDEQTLDIRGLYSQDNTVEQTPIMYQGGAGLVGMFAQVGMHSALIKSQRTEKLSKEQTEANKRITPFTKQLENTSLIELIGTHTSLSTNSEEPSSNVFSTKPIFFCDAEMKELSLKMIAWLPSNQSNSQTEQENNYKNMIHVIGTKLTDTQKEEILNGNQKHLKNKLSSLLVAAINILKNDVTGKYSSEIDETQTFFINEGPKKMVVRGSLLGQECGYQVIQDLHSWYIAFPITEEGQNQQLTPNCNEY